MLNYRAGIREVAASLTAIAKWKRFLPGDASRIAKVVFELATRSMFNDHKPVTRKALFTLIDLLFNKYASPLIRDIGVETLVTGLVSMAEFEKNPSCLEVLFPLYANISRYWTLESTQLDEIWESLARYFPINMAKGANQDTSSPSNEELNALLLQCFVSNDYYAKEVFPRCITLLDAESDLSANTKVHLSSPLLIAH